MRLFYREFGSGPPLIILHGLYGSSDNWISIAKSISSNFKVFLPDLRNHGQSPHSTVHDYNSMRDDLFILADDLKLDKFFLAGHSMGGKVALNFAFTWPEKLNGLLIADISPISEKEGRTNEYNQHLKILNTILSLDISGKISRTEIETQLAQKIKSQKVKSLILKNLKRESDSTFSWKLNASGILKNLDRIMESVVPGESQSDPITGFPVLFLRADYSEYLPENDYERILKVFPGAEFITIPNSGHWIHIDNPEAIENCLLRLLD